MLTIRREQMDLLARSSREEFEQRLLNHFARFYPHEVGQLGREQFLKLIRLGISRAPAYGFTEQREVGLFINLMLMLGCDFGRDPQLPWARELLHDDSLDDSFDRIQRIFKRAVKYLGDCFGDDGRYMARAVIRARNYKLDSAPLSEGDELKGDLLSVLETFCPQKFAAQGVEATRGLIDFAFESAEEHGIESNQGLAVYAILMFLLGCGFYHDPVYPWASSVLGERGLEESVLVQKLYDAAVVHTAAVLSE